MITADMNSPEPNGQPTQGTAVHTSDDAPNESAVTTGHDPLQNPRFLAVLDWIRRQTWDIRDAQDYWARAKYVRTASVDTSGSWQRRDHVDGTADVIHAKQLPSVGMTRVTRWHGVTGEVFGTPGDATDFVMGLFDASDA